LEKQYSQTELDFVFQWVDRWFQLVSLIYDLIRTDRTPPSPPPTELDEINYQGLRFWFIDHEEQFKPLWRDFYESQDLALYAGDDEPTDTSDADEFLENLVFRCYKPANLYRLVRELDIQSGIDVWEPSEHRAWTAAMELLQMDAIMVKFHEWICDQTYETA